MDVRPFIYKIVIGAWMMLGTVLVYDEVATAGGLTAVGDYHAQTPKAFGIEESQNWNVAVTGTREASHYDFGAASCTGTDKTAICTAVGQNLTTRQPLLYLSTNGGSTWNQVTSALM